MSTIDGIVNQLRHEHDRLSKQIQGISAALSAFGSVYSKGTRTRTISAAGRAKIAAAQKARWAKLKKKDGQTKTATPKKRTMSAAAKKRIGDAQRARWAKVKKSA